MSATDLSPTVSGTLLRALVAMRDGDFSVRLPQDWVGLDGKIADTFNDIISANARMANELERVGHVVGKQGKTKQRVKFGLPHGCWGEMETSVNTLVDDLLWPTADAQQHRGHDADRKPAQAVAAAGARAADAADRVAADQ